MVLHVGRSCFRTAGDDPHYILCLGEGFKLTTQRRTEAEMEALTYLDFLQNVDGEVPAATSASGRDAIGSDTSGRNTPGDTSGRDTPRGDTSGRGSAVLEAGDVRGDVVLLKHGPVTPKKVLPLNVALLNLDQMLVCVWVLARSCVLERMCAIVSVCFLAHTCVSVRSLCLLTPTTQSC